MVFHHEDDDRKTQEQEQRHLAEICLDLLFDAGTLAHPFCPVLELHLAERRQLEADYRDNEKQRELEDIELFEESRDLFFEVGEDKAGEECGSRVDPPFAAEPEGLLGLPPESLFGEGGVDPPVFSAIPPGEVSVVAEADAKADNNGKYDREETRRLSRETCSTK